MSCSTCSQARCICAESEAALGLSVDVVEPSGNELNDSELADLLPCDSSSCSSTPADPNQCCNYFNAREGVDGDSFFYSAGGPFALPAAETCSPYACPPSGDMEALPDAPSGSFQSPGILQDVICLDLAPGTYNFQARMVLRQATPGTRVVVLYRPDCNDDSQEYVVSDCFAPCADSDIDATAGTGILNYVDLMCSNFLVVENSTCQPGFRLLVQSGCLECVGGSATPFVENVQILVSKMTGRPIVNCNTSALIPAGLVPHPGTPTCPG